MKVHLVETVTAEDPQWVGTGHRRWGSEPMRCRALGCWKGKEWRTYQVQEQLAFHHETTRQRESRTVGASAFWSPLIGRGVDVAPLTRKRTSRGPGPRARTSASSKNTYSPRLDSPLLHRLASSLNRYAQAEREDLSKGRSYQGLASALAKQAKRQSPTL